MIYHLNLLYYVITITINIYLASFKKKSLFIWLCLVGLTLSTIYDLNDETYMTYTMIHTFIYLSNHQVLNPLFLFLSLHI